MRIRSSQRTVLWGLCAVCLAIAPVPAGADPAPTAEAPTGSAASGYEPGDPFDAEFEDSFDLEVARTSDMHRREPFGLGGAQIELLGRVLGQIE